MDNQQEYFTSDNLNFVSSALLTSRQIVIRRVVRHPKKEFHKIYYLEPFELVSKLYKDYVNDQLQVSPLQLNNKIAVIRCMPAEETE